MQIVVQIIELALQLLVLALHLGSILLGFPLGLDLGPLLLLLVVDVVPRCIEWVTPIGRWLAHLRLVIDWLPDSGDEARAASGSS